MSVSIVDSFHSLLKIQSKSFGVFVQLQVTWAMVTWRQQIISVLHLLLVFVSCKCPIFCYFAPKTALHAADPKSFPEEPQANFSPH